MSSALFIYMLFLTAHCLRYVAKMGPSLHTSIFLACSNGEHLIDRVDPYTETLEKTMASRSSATVEAAFYDSVRRSEEFFGASSACVSLDFVCQVARLEPLRALWRHLVADFRSGVWKNCELPCLDDDALEVEWERVGLAPQTWGKCSRQSDVWPALSQSMTLAGLLDLESSVVEMVFHAVDPADRFYSLRFWCCLMWVILGDGAVADVLSVVSGWAGFMRNVDVCGGGQRVGPSRALLLRYGAIGDLLWADVLDVVQRRRSCALDTGAVLDEGGCERHEDGIGCLPPDFFNAVFRVSLDAISGGAALMLLSSADSSPVESERLLW